MRLFETYIGNDRERFVLGTNGEKTLIVFGINPSTATDTKADHTIARVHGYMARYGFDSFKMLNIYPYRATNPSKLPKTIDKSIHYTNLREITNAIDNASAVLCAWGKNVTKRSYLGDCLSDISKIIIDSGLPVFCVGNTKAGHPFHPLARIKAPENLSFFSVERYLQELNKTKKYNEE